MHYDNQKSSSGGLTTFCYNRSGDVLLVLFIRLAYHEMGSSGFPGRLRPLVFLLVCMTKSAQIPFHTWLPKAIVAPTPIRALVHSRTLVTAGAVFLCHHTEAVLSLQYMVFVSGAGTVILSRVLSLYYNDLKEKIAYSTMNQIG